MPNAFRSFLHNHGLTIRSRRRGAAAAAPTEASTPSIEAYPAILENSTFICERCQSIDFEAKLDSKSEINERFFSLGERQLWDQTCRLCQIFLYLTREDSVGEMYPSNFEFRLIQFRTVALIYEPIYAPSEWKNTMHDTSFAVAARFDPSWAWTMRKNGCITPLKRDGGNEQIAARTVLPTADFGIVRSWIDFCVDHHAETCGSSALREMMPFKIIDCETRTLLLAPPKTTYLALSYVWGAPSPGDHSSHASKLPSTLPKVVEDAIITTQKMGLQYLWIDRYCIDQQDLQEKAIQIQQMDLIYNNALAVIVAASGEDSESGLPGIRIRSPSTTLELNRLALSLIPADHNDSIIKSKWNTRGWTYQEIILARRRIVFLKNQIYFECQGMSIFEGLDMSPELATNMSRGFQQSSDTGKAHMFNFISKQDDPLEHVYQHIFTYSRRQLTWPGDILNGLAGVFQALRSIYPQFYHHFGVPIVPDTTSEVSSLVGQSGRTRHSTITEQFVTGLCWRYDEDELPPSKREGEFPTWSWAGWKGKLARLEMFYNDRYIANTFNVKIQLLPTNCEAPVSLESEGLLESLASRAWAPRILLDTPVLPIKFIKFTRSWGRNVGWIGTIKVDDGYIFHGRLALEDPKIRPDPESVGNTAKLHSEKWTALVLGERIGIAWSNGIRTLVPDETPVIVILLVVQVEHGKWERIGLLEIGDKDSVEMDDNEDVQIIKNMSLNRKITLLR